MLPQCPPLGKVTPELAFLEAGPLSSDVSVVFLHGWLDNAASFERVMAVGHEQMPAVHFCAVDLPGHGYSPAKFGNNFYLFHDYLFDLYTFLNTLPQKKHILIGHSLGGLIASCYCAAFPEQVSALLQIEGLGPLFEPAEQCVARMRDGIISRRRILNKPVKGYRSYDAALHHRAKRCGLSAAQIQPIVDRGLINRDGIWYWRADIKLHNRSVYRMTREQACQVIAAIHCPYRVLVGDHGYADVKDKLTTLLPDHARSFELHGGHYCHLENVNEVVKHLTALIQASA